jgi:beta-glucosidase
LIGKDYNDPLWDELLTQLTVKEMRVLIGTGNFNTAEIASIGKPKTTDPDGPAGFTNFMTVTADTAVVYDTCFYASECIIGATWNVELAQRMGEAAGNESLVGNERGDKRTYSGWYAPAVNIHRSPFSGRNWEYYSEDGFLSGKMAAGVISGAKSKGVYTYVKHFAINDQETDRDKNGLITWLNEQSMREIYLKPFEMAVKEGKTNAIMSSFNRIGTVWAGGSYELLTEVLRNEWGFQGMVITDYNTNEYMHTDQMIRAGGDLNLIQDKQPSSSGATNTPSHLQSMRRATKNILFTVANSNAMNGMGEGIRYGYALPYWMIALFALDAVVVIALAAWGYLAIRRSARKQKR